MNALMVGAPSRATLAAMLGAPQIAPEQLASLGESELRALAAQLLARSEHHNHEIDWRDAKLEELAYEIAHLRRMKFSAQRKALFEGSVDADIAALEAELEELKTPPLGDDKKTKPKRAALPQDLPHIQIGHEPDSTTCACGYPLQRVGEDVSQKLDYTPGVFTVQNHVRGKWACRDCRTLTQTPVPSEIIDKGISTAGLLARVLVAKHSDHLPAVQAGSDLRPCRPGHPALDAGGLGGRMRRAAAAVGGRIEAPHMAPEQRLQVRQERARPITMALQPGSSPSAPRSWTAAPPQRPSTTA